MSDSIVGDLSDPRALLTAWLRRSTEREILNFGAANTYNAWHYGVGIPALILTTLAGSDFWSSLQNHSPFSVKMLVSVLKVVAPVLVGLQTFLGLGSLAERHRKVAGKYGAVKRLIQETLALRDISAQDLAKSVTDVRKQIDNIEGDEPQLPRLIWSRVKIAKPDATLPSTVPKA